jgi:hypothetical protein
MFDIRRHPQKRYWIFLSEEFVEKHPDFSGQFWAVTALVLIIVLMYNITVWAKAQDRNFTPPCFAQVAFSFPY